MFKHRLTNIVPQPPQLINSYFATKFFNMNNLFRALIAGYGAKKLGGGCLGTIIVFVIIWYALGYC